MSQINVDAIRNQGGSGAKIQMLASGDVNVNDNKLYVDNATSKVGINTNDPRAALEVEGNGGVILKTSPVAERINNISGASNANRDKHNQRIHHQQDPSLKVFTAWYGSPKSGRALIIYKPLLFRLSINSLLNQLKPTPLWRPDPSPSPM